jgi:hypothetical protein
MSGARCIWDRKATTGQEPREHILGEGLVGEQTFYAHTPYGARIGPGTDLCLRAGEVCGDCNHRNGRLDQFLVDQFGLFRVYLNPVGTKKGRPATAVRPGMFAERRGDEMHVTFNGEKYPVRNVHGVTVGPTKGKEHAVRIDDWSVVDGVARWKFHQPISLSKLFNRALHKIAFELLCFQAGPEYVLDSRFDPIRDYVLYGRGTRRFALWPRANGENWATPSLSLNTHPEWGEWVAILDLAARFYVDLSPRCELLMEKMRLTEASRLGLVVLEDGKGALNPPGVAA